MFGLSMIHEMDNFQREMDNLFRGVGFAPALKSTSSERHFAVEDKGDAFEVNAILPGLDADKLDIGILGRRLTVAGEYRCHEAPEEAVWHRRERAEGRFERTILLPANVDTDKVEAEYQQGELQIKLPKAASAMPKKISVSAA